MNKKTRYEYYKKWRNDNPGKTHEYYMNRKEKGETGYDAEYYAANKEDFKQRQYKSNEKNKEKRKAYSKAYYLKNREKMLAQAKAYQKLKKYECELSDIIPNQIIKNGEEIYDEETKTFKKIKKDDEKDND